MEKLKLLKIEYIMEVALRVLLISMMATFTVAFWLGTFLLAKLLWLSLFN